MGSRPAGERASAAVVGVAAFTFSAVMIGIGSRGHPQTSYAFYAFDAVGMCFLVGGLALWWQRPANPLGKVMVAAGALWNATNLQLADHPALAGVGFLLTYLPPFVVGHAALLYPDGRFRRPGEGWFMVAAYTCYLLLQGQRYLSEGVGEPIGWPDGTKANTAGANATAIFGLVCNALVLTSIVRRWRAASPSTRRLHSPVWIYSVTLLVVISGAIVAGIATMPTSVQVTLFLGYGLGLLGFPFAFLAGLARVRLARQRVADLVLALRDPVDPARLRDLLARTLGDPTLVLGFWSSAAGCYVDVDGRTVEIPADRTAREVTLVDGRDGKLAALVHEPALAEQRALVRAVVAAAQLALENTRLQALLYAHLAELAASRARIAEAALNERRSIERNLHDGLQHRLLRLSWLAERAKDAVGSGPAGSLVTELGTEARHAYTALRELARGIHPAILSEQGLACAVEEFALRSHVPMDVVLPGGRWPAPVEATAFFVIQEAATNAAKHASASRISVRGEHQDGRLVVEVADDGVGGADPRRGTGLRGLQDRVTAIGGTLTVRSAFQQGTSVTLDLPCE